MKTVITGLVILAALKLYVHNEIFKDATETAVINAYRAHAIIACQNDARHYPETKEEWSAPRSIQLKIGDGVSDVNLWDVDHPQWETAFKQPYLVLRPNDQKKRVKCTYDVNADAAVITAA